MANGLTVIEGLKVVDKGQDVGVTDGDATKDSNLVADHVLLALHQLFVDHLDGISLASFNLSRTEEQTIEDKSGGQ